MLLKRILFNFQMNWQLQQYSYYICAGRIRNRPCGGGVRDTSELNQTLTDITTGLSSVDDNRINAQLSWLDTTIPLVS